MNIVNCDLLIFLEMLRKIAEKQNFYARPQILESYNNE